jgi:hypothetical protein
VLLADFVPHKENRHGTAAGSAARKPAALYSQEGTADPFVHVKLFVL